MPRRRTMAVRVGDDVIARDKKCIWYAAKVTAERGEGRHRQLKVHFLGWRARFDEWLSPRLVTKRSKQPVCGQLAEANWSSSAGYDCATGTWSVNLGYHVRGKTEQIETPPLREAP